MSNADLFDYVKANAKQLFGSQFWEARLVCKADVGPKPDKLESRILVLSKFRLFFLSGKVASKLHIEASYHLLAVTEISASGVQSEVSLTVDGRRLFIRLVDQDITGHDVAIHLLTAFKHYFPNCDVHRFVELSPTNLYATYAQLPSARPTLPCNGFRRTYASLCDFYKHVFRDEIVWDVEKIYSLHSCTVLRLDDFSHLSPKDLIPLVATLQFSSWFTGIASESLKLANDVIDVIITVLKKSQRIKELTLKNCGLKLDFLQSVAQALSQNPTIPLEVINLSGNTFDDNKSVAQFAASLVSLNARLKIINFEDCCLTVKGANSLCSALQRNQERNETPSLIELNFAKNSFKEDVSELYHLVCHSPSLTSLNVSGAGLPLEKLWNSLKPCSNTITTLKLSGCLFSARKSTKDLAIPTSLKDFISSATALKTLDLSDCVLPAEIFKFLLLGLACNQTIEDVNLDLTRSCTEKASISVLETCMPNLTVVSELSLRDCGLEQDVLILLPAVGRMPNLRRLDIGGNNFVGTRKQPTKQIKNILMEIVKLISDEDSPLRELCLSDCRIGVSLCVLLNALGVAPRLKFLDISGNEIGNFGARLLSKALQVNSALETLLIDRNQITFEGYADIAHALKENNSLVVIPYPLHDASESLKINRERTENALNEIERALRRNNCNQGFVSCVEANSWIYETHSKLLLGNIEDELNKAASRTAQLLNDWKYFEDNPDVVVASKLLQDAENVKLMLDELLSDLDEGDFIVGDMKNSCESLMKKIDDSLKMNAKYFAEFPAKKSFSVCQNNEFSSSLCALCLQKAQMDVTSSISEFSKALRQRYSSVQFNMAATVSEKICQELVKALNAVNKNLSNSKKASIGSNAGVEKPNNSTSGTPTGKKKFKWFSNKNRPLSIVEGHGVPNFADLADDQDGSMDAFDNRSVEINNDETKTSDEISSSKDGTQPLTHMQKGRARPPRNYKVKAPQPPVSGEHEGGVDNFFAHNKSATLPSRSSQYEKLNENNFSSGHNLKIDVAASPENVAEKRVSRMPGVPVLTPGVLQQLGARISPRNETENHQPAPKEAEHVVKIAKLPPPKPIGIKLPIHSAEELHSTTLKSPNEPPPPLLSESVSSSSSSASATSSAAETSTTSYYGTTTTTTSEQTTSKMSPSSSSTSESQTITETSMATIQMAPTTTQSPTTAAATNNVELSFTGTQTSTPLSTSAESSSETTTTSATATKSDNSAMETSSSSSPSSIDKSDPVVAPPPTSPKYHHASSLDFHVVDKTEKQTTTTNFNDSMNSRAKSSEPVSQDHNGNPPVFQTPKSVSRPDRPPLPSKPPPARPPPFQRVWEQPSSDDVSTPVTVAMRPKIDSSSSDNAADQRKSVLEMRKVFEASKAAAAAAHHASMSSAVMTTTTTLDNSKPVPPPRVRTNKVAPTD